MNPHFLSEVESLRRSVRSNLHRPNLDATVRAHLEAELRYLPEVIVAVREPSRAPSVRRLAKDAEVFDKAMHRIGESATPSINRPSQRV
jgi:hypothetical protein